jgi:hypothetical protein
VNGTAQLRYSDILENLKGFDDWLRRLGVPVRQADRAHHAIRVLEEAERAFQSGKNRSRMSKSDYLFGLTEALELHDVYLAFHRHPPQQLRERLTRALSGPALPEAETAISRDGRNVMFELALGAEWALCGADVELLEPDLLLKMPSRGYFTACKRPEHEHGIRAAVRSAASQLRSALASAPDDTFGIVAVCISRVLNPGNAYFSGSYRQLSELVNMLMDRHRKDWRTTDFHPRNMAVLFYAHTPADWGNGLFRLSAVRIGPTCREESVHQNLSDDMTRLYSNSR